MTRPARRIAGFTESVIREMTRLAHEHDALNLAQGFPDFAPPTELVAAAQAALAAGDHQYSITWGSPRLRQALAAKVSRWWGGEIDPEREVTVTCGATEGIVASLMGVVDPGDEVIVFEPYYENYVPAGLLAGAALRFVTLQPPDFRISPESLTESLSPRTRAVILNSPNNPTGRVLTRFELEIVAQVCRDNDLVLITDEIYEHILYDGREHIPAATLPGMRARTIAVGGLSKTFSVTGWRLGYVVAPPALSEGVRKAHDFLTVAAPTPLQEAAAVYLGVADEFYAEIPRFYSPKRAALAAALQAAGLPCRIPEGAYYMLAEIDHLGFATDREAAEWFVREIGVAGVPASSFYQHPHPGGQMLRFTFCKRDATLEEVARRLARLRDVRPSSTR